MKKISTKEIADSLRTDINWPALNSLIIHIGSSLNNRKDRFQKSDLLERAVEKFSYGILKYIDEEGRDFYYTKFNVHLEMKFISYGIHKRTGSKRDNINSIILLNSRNTNTHVNLPPKYSDFVMVVDEISSAVISKEKISPYVKSHGDGLMAHKVCMGECELITYPSDYAVSTPIRIKSYKDRLENLQEVYLNDIMKAIGLPVHFKQYRHDTSNTLLKFMKK